MTSRFAVIGLGRAGHSFRESLTRIGWTCHGHFGRDYPAALTNHVDAVILAVPDSAITDVATRLTPGTGAVVHLSGATTLQPLSNHRRRASVHPLMSLPDASTGADRLLAGTVFAVAGDHIARRMVVALGGTPITVPDEIRALYHATAAVAANHLTALCGQVERLAASANVPVDAYWRLMQSTLENVAQLGAQQALTGPAARGDQATIDAHLTALPADERPLYQTLADAAATLAGAAPKVATVSPSLASPSPSGQLEIFTSIAEFRTRLDQRRSEGETVGFVPTMGFLHDGHASLMRQSARENTVTVASIFVNPLQFAANEDLSSYPRDFDRDCEIAADAGAAIIFAPDVGEMYPDGAVSTTVSVGSLAQRWEGESRPTHFDGVATVVSKLFNIVGPCRSYFGEKDFQQLAVIRAMARDLSVPVEVVGCPIVREADGLAMSSRNVYLSDAQRSAAPVLRKTLDLGSRLIRDSLEHRTQPGAASPDGREEVEAAMKAFIAAEPLAQLDYVAIVDPTTLEPASELSDTVRLLIAARVGTTRLIDNSGVGRTHVD